MSTLLEDIDKERLLAYVKVSEGCWLWTGTVGALGYGAFRLNGKTQRAHRVVYSLLTDIPLECVTLLEHACDTKLCCNPSHLFESNHRNNNRRARGWTYEDGEWLCKNGHKQVGKAVIKRAEGREVCRVCLNTNRRKRRWQE